MPCLKQKNLAENQLRGRGADTSTGLDTLSPGSDTLEKNPENKFVFGA